jgi:ABC-type transport system involved in multi-copper enzyme maturation permease subunit
MSKVLAIALNTFKEAVRNRILYVLLFFAGLILLGSWVASTLSIANQDRVMRDLGTASINIIGLLIAVFVGIGLVYNEMDKKTIYTIISKPIARWQFIVGKYLGLVLTIALNVIIMMWFFCMVLHFRQAVNPDVMFHALWTEVEDGPYIPPSALDTLFYYGQAVVTSAAKGTLNVLSLGIYTQPATAGLMMNMFMICLELMIITAFAVLYSTFSSPTLSAFLTVLTFIIGSLNSDLYVFAQTLVAKAGGIDALATGQQIGYYLLLAASYLMPNLEVFNLGEEIAYNLPVGFDPYAWAYGLIYSAAIVIVAVLAFNRRNFK